MAETVINVDGMKCANCVKSVTEALKAISGVANVDISLADKKVKVSYDDVKTNLKTLEDAIDDLGFEVIK